MDVDTIDIQINPVGVDLMNVRASVRLPQVSRSIHPNL